MHDAGDQAADNGGGGDEHDEDGGADGGLDGHLVALAGEQTLIDVLADHGIHKTGEDHPQQGLGVGGGHEHVIVGGELVGHGGQRGVQTGKAAHIAQGHHGDPNDADDDQDDLEAVSHGDGQGGGYDAKVAASQQKVVDGGVFLAVEQTDAEQNDHVDHECNINCCHLGSLHFFLF